VEPEAFVIMKKGCEEKIERLEINLTDVKLQSSNLASLDKMIYQAIEALSDLKNLCLHGNVLKKKEILGSIFRKNCDLKKVNIEPEV